MAGDCFITFKGKRQGAISGEAQDELLKGAIDVESWHWGAETPVSHGMTDQIGRIKVRPMVFKHRIDNASALLLSALATHEQAEAELLMRRAGGPAQTYLKIAFKDVRIVQIDIDYDGGAQVPLEAVTFSFAKLSYDYSPQTKIGGQSGWRSWQYDMPEH